MKLWEVKQLEEEEAKEEAIEPGQEFVRLSSQILALARAQTVIRHPQASRESPILRQVG